MCLDKVAVVLFRPRLAENIGAVARAACNMGLRRLIAVQPLDLDFDRMAMMATGHAVELLNRLEVHDDLVAALAPFQYVVGTTARWAGVRRDYFTPGRWAQKIIEVSVGRQTTSPCSSGRENFGLTNEELPLCHAW